MQTSPPLRPRRDGWTPERQLAFIQALADCGTVTAAAARVGMSREAAYRLRRLPEAADFRTAWDAALAEGWRRVQETALERVITGETMVSERGGVTTTRHRPCAPQVLIRMLDRAVKALAAERAVADAKVARLMTERVAIVRAEIRALGDPETAEAYMAEDRKPDPIPDAETLIMRRLHELSQGFFEPEDWDVPAVWDRNDGAHAAEKNPPYASTLSTSSAA
ncbi:MAG: hypothetical protein ACOYLS_12715 [Polymorphobacter sp.]